MSNFDQIRNQFESEFQSNPHCAEPTEDDVMGLLRLVDLKYISVIEGFDQVLLDGFYTAAELREIANKLEEYKTRYDTKH